MAQTRRHPAARRDQARDRFLARHHNEVATERTDVLNKMKWNVVVGRYNSDSAAGAAAAPATGYPPPYENAAPRRYQRYEVELPEHAVVLDALIEIREYQDESLVVRCACRSAICGSCAMWVNGHARLACKSKLAEFTTNGKTRVESPPSMPIIRDLVC